MRMTYEKTNKNDCKRVSETKFKCIQKAHFDFKFQFFRMFFVYPVMIIAVPWITVVTTSRSQSEIGSL